ncbi:protein-tyrosine phosphatase-like protein [Amylocystis lapponica]|nr:protein-tyrosine phosphatase-like protein [Amylocystis lapponica]
MDTGIPPPTPEWLKSSSSSAHIATVIQILIAREKDRARARNVSRSKSHPSVTHRLSHLPSTLTTKSELSSHYSIAVGTHPDNIPGNRYADIEPYDRTRVVVSQSGVVQGVDRSPAEGRYLNASWVRELLGGKWWIATQAPLPETAHAFLSVVLQPITRPPPTLYSSQSSSPPPKTSRVRTIVQLTRNVESGMRKAHVYFPPIDGQSWILSPEDGCSSPSLKVTLLKTKSIDEAHCVQSTVSIEPLTLSSSGSHEKVEPVVFQHMLYGSWPDHGVPKPEDCEALLNFVKLVDETNRNVAHLANSDELDPDPPVMVGCSAGVGRTGAFIVLSSLLRAHGFLAPSAMSRETASALPPLAPSPLGPLPEEIRFDLVAQEIDMVREQRPGMIQRDSQVLFVYNMLNVAFSGRWRPSTKAG